jgi:hypothetical protein
MIMDIPSGYKKYEGPVNWKLVKGAKYWDRNACRWRQINGGAYATPDGPLIIRNTR